MIDFPLPPIEAKSPILNLYWLLLLACLPAPLVLFGRGYPVNDAYDRLPPPMRSNIMGSRVAGTALPSPGDCQGTSFPLPLSPGTFSALRFYHTGLCRQVFSLNFPDTGAPFLE